MKNAIIIIILSAGGLFAKDLEQIKTDSFLKDLDKKQFKKVCETVEAKGIKSFEGSKFSLKEKRVVDTLRNNNPGISVEEFKKVCEKAEWEEKIELAVDNVVNPGTLKIREDGDIEIINAFFEPIKVDKSYDDDDSQEDPTPLNLDYNTEPEYYYYYNQKPLPNYTPAAQTQGDTDNSGNNYVLSDAGSMPADLKQQAMEYFNANSSRISNKDFIGVVDFSLHSSKSRFYIINVKDGSAKLIHVAHGSGSDPDNDGYATYFSNKSGSKASSVGFYLTGGEYKGKYGRSLKLHGLSSTNSNAYSRAVVLHPSAYVTEANAKAGRSWGCLAVSFETVNSVVNNLRGGALIFASLSGR